MLVTTIAGIENVPVGTNLEAVSGKILKIYEYKSGKNDKGIWSLQNLSFQDATGKTTVVLKNRPELAANWAGADVYFVAGQHKNRPTGVLVDEYKEKRRIMVNEYATLEEGEAQSQQRQAAPTQQRQQAPQQGPSQPRTDYQALERQEQENARPASQQRQQALQRQAPAEKPPEEKLHDAKKDILRLVSLYTICHDAAVLHASSVYSRHGHLAHPASIGALATTLFIEANRKQIGQSIPAVAPTQIPPPQFKMGDIVTAWEEHQAELGLAPKPAPSDNSSDPKDLPAMEEKQW